jgi:hypothetical protein
VTKTIVGVSSVKRKSKTNTIIPEELMSFLISSFSLQETTARFMASGAAPETDVNAEAELDTQVVLMAMSAVDQVSALLQHHN